MNKAFSQFDSLTVSLSHSCSLSISFWRGVCTSGLGRKRASVGNRCECRQEDLYRGVTKIRTHAAPRMVL